MKDSLNRNITYLRVSVTDRCNLRCSYCAPAGKLRILPKKEILSFDEIELTLRAAVSVGINKLRITGGEPFLRKNVMQLVRKIAAIPGLARLGITTNGILLEQHLEELRPLAPDLNVSLDTLDSQKYRHITQNDGWDKTWNAIQKAISLGFREIKINTVVMKGVNDDEIEAFAKLTFLYPVQVRFIEFMPAGCWNTQNELFVPGEAIISSLANLGRLRQEQPSPGGGPAKIYSLPNSAGTVGIIDAVSHPFCHSCNRLRLTADGKLKPCLFSQEYVDIKPALRLKPDTLKIEKLFLQAANIKPASQQRIRNFAMSSIGG